MFDVHHWNPVHDMNIENQRYVGLTYELKLIVPIDQHLYILYHHEKMQYTVLQYLKLELDENNLLR